MMASDRERSATAAVLGGGQDPNILKISRDFSQDLNVIFCSIPLKFL
jgi:hypothetical protein